MVNQKSGTAGTILGLVSALWLGLFLSPEPGWAQGLDYARYYSFNGQFLRDALFAGEFPWWNPYVALGRPFATDLQTAVFYPGTWLLLGAGTTWGTALNLWLHLWLSGWGMAGLARAWGLQKGTAIAVGIAWIIGVPMSVRILIGQIHYVDSLAWLPLVFWSVSSWCKHATPRATVAVVAVSGLQFLAGHPQVFWFTHLAVAGWLVLVTRNRLSVLLRWAGLMVITALLTASVWLPFASMIAASSRGWGGAHLMEIGALRPTDWLALVLPSRDGFLADTENQLHLSIPVLLLGGVGLRLAWNAGGPWRGLLGVMLGAGLLASAWPGATDVAKLAIPGFGSFRMPARLGVLVVFGALLVAGYAWENRTRISLASLGCWMGALVLVVLLWSLGDVSTRWPHLVWTLGFSGITLGVWSVRARVGERLLAAGIAVLMIGETSRHWTVLRDWYVIPQEFPAETFLPGLVQELRAEQGHPAPPRINLSARWARENFGMIAGYSTFNGYTSLYDQRVWRTIHAQADLPVPQMLTSFPDVRIWERSPFIFDGMSLAFGFDPETGRMALAPNPSPRAFARSESGATVGSVQIESFALNRVALTADLPTPATVILGEAYADGWKVEANGSSENALIVDDWKRAVALPAGQHKIVWTYRPPHGRTGLALAGLGVVILGGLSRRLQASGPAPG